MSNFRNALKRRVHQERSQPKARERLGLLEKHKDYKIRAKDFHRKNDTINLLKQKASLKNPDEFYFEMKNSEVKADGKHAAKIKGHKYSAAVLKTMKSQDIGYLTMKKQTEAKKIARLESQLHLLGGNTQNKHAIFVEDEAEAEDFDACKHFDTLPELLNRKHNRPRTSALKEAPLFHGQMRKIERERSKQYRELDGRRKREKEITKVLDKMEMQKHLMGKGRRIKRKFINNFGEEEEDKAVYKWKLQRKT